MNKEPPLENQNEDPMHKREFVIVALIINVIFLGLCIWGIIATLIEARGGGWGIPAFTLYILTLCLIGIAIVSIAVFVKAKYWYGDAKKWYKGTKKETLLKIQFIISIFSLAISIITLIFCIVMLIIFL